MNHKDLLLRVSHLSREYRVGKNKVTGIRDVSFSLEKGEILGIVGESGSGKSTLGRLIAGLDTPTDGKVEFNGERVQMVFQNPFSSVNPRMKLAQIISEPWKIQKIGSERERRNKVQEILTQVGLPVSCMDSYPRELSGGQLQRAVIGRSLMLTPSLLVADEPTASLDVSMQAQIIQLLLSVRERTGMGLILISHDLELIRYLCRYLVVLDHGSLAEFGETKTIWDNPKSNAAKALLSGKNTL